MKKNELLTKTKIACWGWGCANASSSWNWGRWILFVLFILAILSVILAAIRINKRRNIEGREPIRGTAWITPPSYLHATNNQQTQQPFVPPYTAQANDNDAGYYDNQGTFHPNFKAQEAAANSANGQYGQSQHLNTLVPDQTGVSSPSNTYQPPSGPPPGQAQVQFTGDDHELNFQRDFSRYYNNQNQGNSSQFQPPSGPPPGQQQNDLELDNFSRPEGPPPAHLKN
ncbi:hypothetical protein BN7_5027 [Wickerhamomyces ciferrii]|uniref:Protein RCR2 n=1 Tax=Wickerhamomyces ciferrii (strain ATCC 14091 / BCRC 22168 / CBS 111 / JCM 3599 / NBRC 0793 / NRRL Y-1031 F-60-10) TaxID=1206466 RepID=K0KJK4_WICCF|nr:uncharacterized protein BN7_5027 [Wickerhamomyces ciferrii]CCH45445.1 hypothetical protein BN7_5027 [Wickerhamomyces ciferrii]